MAVLDAEDGVIIHTNHFRSASLAPEDALLASLPDSAWRQRRMEALLADRHGRITIDDLKRALSDHDHWPTSICRHESEVRTIASIIAEPEQGRLHVAGGTPCSSDFVTYSL
jgi:isopenicillin-N N-acyltransferase-like protein